MDESSKDKNESSKTRHPLQRAQSESGIVQEKTSALQKEHLMLVKQIEVQRMVVKQSKDVREKDKLQRLEEREQAVNKQLTEERMLLLQEYKNLKTKAQEESRKKADMASKKGYHKTESASGGNKWGKTKKSNSKTKTVDFASLFVAPNGEKSNSLILDNEEAVKMSKNLLQLFAESKRASNVAGMPVNVVSDFAVKTDINVNGLRRAGKDKVADSGKKQYQMEDVAVCICPFQDDFGMAFFGVFDGHSGKNAAKAASEFIPMDLARNISTYRKEGKGPLTDCTEILKETFDVVDWKLRAFEHEGTTATCVFVWQEGEKRYLQAANVGDSTAFLSHDGTAICLSKDHKVTDAEEQERLGKMGIVLNEGQTRINGLKISRALGDWIFKDANAEPTGVISEPYVSPVFELTDKDACVIIASDGLWDVISGKKAVDIVKTETNAEEMAKKLINTALVSPKCQDNISIICVIP